MQEKSENEEKNVRLKAKLFQLQEELSRLKKERNALAGKSKELKMNIAIN